MKVIAKIDEVQPCTVVSTFDLATPPNIEQKGKQMLQPSIFSFSHHVFKSSVLSGSLKLGLVGSTGLTWLVVLGLNATLKD